MLTNIPGVNRLSSARAEEYPISFNNEVYVPGFGGTGHGRWGQREYGMKNNVSG